MYKKKCSPTPTKNVCQVVLTLFR